MNRMWFSLEITCRILHYRPTSVLARARHHLTDITQHVTSQLTRDDGQMLL